MRLSLVPTIYGQDAVLRIQDRQKLATLDLAGLGLTSKQIDGLMRAASKSRLSSSVPAAGRPASCTAMWVHSDGIASIARRTDSHRDSRLPGTTVAP